MSFSTVCQSYQDDVRVKMKGCVQWNSFMIKNLSASIEHEPVITRSAVQRLTHSAAGAPIDIASTCHYSKLVMTSIMQNKSCLM